MPARFYLYPFKTGDILKLKKSHPCGGYLWKIERVGADIGIRCLKCDRFQSLPRQKLEKAVKSIIEPEKQKPVKGVSDDE